MAEAPVRAVITSRFDLGFIVTLPDGTFGELRVPQMSRSTAEYDRSPEKHAGIGIPVDVYLVRTSDDRCLVSEFSANDRLARDQKREDWITAQEQASVGDTLFVRVERKLEWGCSCRQEKEPFLEGVLSTLETVAQKHLPLKCAATNSDLDQLTTGSTLSVIIVHKEWAHWRYVLYFSVHQ